VGVAENCHFNGEHDDKPLDWMPLGVEVGPLFSGNFMSILQWLNHFFLGNCPSSTILDDENSTWMCTDLNGT
jgi:hypothetical protein